MGRGYDDRAVASYRARARLALLFATVVWGATFVVVQEALADLGVFHLLVLRFTLGVLLLLPFLKQWRSPGILRDGIAVGVALFAGYALQTLGLLWTTPSRSAFLTGLTVLFVPIVGTLIGRPRPRPGLWLAALIAIAGLWVIYRPAASPTSFGLGDLLTLGCALAFACHVLTVEKVVHRQPARLLAVVQFSTVALLSSPSLAIHPLSARELTVRALIAVAITGALATAAALLCQLYAQRHLSATETAVLLTLEPLIAMATSIWVGAEAWSLSLGAGGALILVAMLLAQLGVEKADTPAGFTPPRA
ncbi:MAG TPA: DMT family transporter [Thermoanaerobaculia bacterium]|nr:DMT family transporter [Thermoanaerobaculia bacterium]